MSLNAPNHVSVVIPVFQGVGTLSELVERVERVLRAHYEVYEIVLVEDASPDESWKLVCELAKRISNVRAMRLRKNAGQHPATLCGICAARYSIIVTLDDDLEHPPEEIPKLVHTLTEGNFDLVYGLPRVRRQPWIHTLMSRAMRTGAYLITGEREVLVYGAFRAFRSSVCHPVREFRGGALNLDTWLGSNVRKKGTVFVSFSPRYRGRSSYRLGKRLEQIWGVFHGLKLRRSALLGATGKTEFPDFYEMSERVGQWDDL